MITKAVISTRILFIFLSLLLISASPYLQNSIVVEENSVVIDFPETIHFNAIFNSSEPIQKVFLILDRQGMGQYKHEMTPMDDGSYGLVLKIADTPIIPFSTNLYWFEIQTEKGISFRSPSFSFEYDDDRFDWLSTSTELFQIHYYDRSGEFNDLALDWALAGLRSATTILPVSPEFPIRIYIYNHAIDLQSALQYNHYSWVSGHTIPEGNTIFISIPVGEGQDQELARQLPHEIIHVIQFKEMGDNYSHLPIWFAEGTASLAEIDNNPAHETVLKDAVISEALIPLESLCTTFPSDGERAFLAYAQSASFLKFLVTEIGEDIIPDLLQAYKSGYGCKEGLEFVSGRTFEELEALWYHESLGIVKPLKIGGWIYILPAAGIPLITGIIVYLYKNKRRKSRSGGK